MLEKDITQLGMSDKEAKVYLASLELGPSPVQKISQKAKVNRATTYVVIDSLMEMGLMSTYEEGKKTYFTAEQPERLLEFLKQQQGQVEEKVTLLKERMPELKSIYNAYPGKPKVKYYEGSEGLKSVYNDFLETLDQKGTIYTFFPYDEFEKVKMDLPNFRKKRIEKNIKTKVMYCSRKGKQQAYENEGVSDLDEFVFLDCARYCFQGGVNIYGNKLFMIDYLGRLGGIVIENKTLANTIQQIFSLAWDCSTKEKK